MNDKNKEFDDLVKLPHGVSDFKKLIKGNYKFIDKTLFIKDIMHDGAEVIVITRPRRFGKTLNLSMLYHFLHQTDVQDENLFSGLEISNYSNFCSRYQNQYPVIFISFKGVKRPSYEEAYETIEELIRSLCENYRFLLEGDLLSESEKSIFLALLNKTAKTEEIHTSLKQLSLYLTRKFNKEPIILIDEYDTPIQEAYLREYYEKMIDLMRAILGEALKDNDNLGKAVVTGITRVSQESLFSGVNNLEVYSLLREDYGQYFGFTENEVIKLISETKQQVSINAIREWYNGYQISHHTLYNPWSIISCLKNRGALKPYWINTSSNDLVGKLLTNANSVVKQRFGELLQDKIIEQPLSENLVFTDIEKRESSLWSLLLYAGYLKVLSSELRGRRLMAKIAIPNKEVKFVYDQVVEQWFDDARSLESYDEFVQALSDGDLDKFKMYLSSYIMETGSYFDFNKNTPEQIFHIFILGLVVGLRDHYYIYSNRESGIGRFDVMFIPHDKKKKGILLEFKIAEKAELLQDKALEALQQIKDKQYIEEFQKHKINSVLAVGLSFFAKQVELVHEDIKCNKV